MKDAAPTSRWSRLPIIGPVVRFFRRDAAGADVSDSLPASGIKTYHCGTLTYTKAGLMAVCAGLLWGDFCLVLMDTVVPSVLPLKLKALGSPNWLMGLILSSLPSLLNTIVCPVVSFKSDRYRSKWGRRIPFLAGTLPFLVVSLVLLGCSEDISGWLQTHMPFLRNVAPATVTIALIAVFMMVFQFFNLFVNSVFWYLFNDVVPAQHVARISGMNRIVSSLASALYSYFFFRYAETNMRETLIGAALLYFIGFTLVCVIVKEGEYPPMEGEDDKASRGFGAVKTFLKESFSVKWYLLFFAWGAIPILGGGTGIFMVFFNREMGLSLDDMGKLGALATVPPLFAMYLASTFVDRWHPMRVQVYVGIFMAFAAFANWVWIFVTLPGKYFFWLSLGTAVIGSFFGALQSVCAFPLLMRVFPKSRFGQFCSALALLRSVVWIVAGTVGGLFVDGVAWLCRNSGYGPNFVYRFLFLWTGFSVVVPAAVGIWAYVYWHRLGGYDGYQPPAPWSPNKTEALDVVPTVGPQFRWLSLSLRLFDAVMGLSVLSLPALMWWMHQRGATIALRWYAILVLPFFLAVWIGWKFLERGIRRDMARCLSNEPLHNGIPHHGVLMVVSIQYLLSLSIWVAQVIVTVKLNMEWECIIFGIANAVANLLLTTAVLVIWRMERGRSNTLETGGGKAGALPNGGVAARSA